MSSLLVLLALMSQPAGDAKPGGEPLRGNWKPFAIDWSESPQSVVDLSRYVDAPAGKHGAIRANSERLVDGRGERFRIYGVNLTGEITFGDSSEVDRVADDLARAGINAVRLHHLDPPWFRGGIFGKGESTQQLDPDNLDRLDRLVAALKRRGIYTNLNLNVFRQYRAEDGVPDAQSLGIAKGATYFDPRLIELQQQFIRQLLTHQNPYTGLAYKDDPAIMTVELLNENSLIEAWLGNRLSGEPPEWGSTWSALPKSYQEQLDGLWQDYLAANVGAEKVQGWKRAEGIKELDPLPRTTSDRFTSRLPEIVRTEAAFLIEIERRFFADMKTLLDDEIGVSAMIVGDADHNDSIFGYPHIVNNAMFDLLDGHGYWKHPSLGDTVSLDNVPMVGDAWDNTVVQFARTPMVGKPYTISETNHPFPHEFAAEGMPILTAYALFHDWDGIYWFSYKLGHRGNPAEDPVKQSMLFGIDQLPIKRAMLHACGAMWHGQSVTPAKRRIVRTMDPARLSQQFGGPEFWGKRPFFDETFPKTVPLVHATRWRLSDEPGDDVEEPSDPFVSDTGELTWTVGSRKQGTVTIDTPTAQGLLGFISSMPAETSLVDVEVDNQFAAVLLVPLDDQPIAESDRLLLVAADSESNTDLRWAAGENDADRKTVTDWGTGPSAIRPLSARVNLRGLGTRPLTVQPLSAAGVPIGQPVRYDDVGDVRISLDQTTVWYLLTR